MQDNGYNLPIFHNMRTIIKMTRPSTFNRDELLSCGNGEMFGLGNARLPVGNMLMMDRIVHISEEGGLYGKGQIIAELDICLERHELVKVKIRADREERKAMAAEIIEASNSQQVQSIGQVVTLFRANPKQAVYELPK